MKFLLSIIVYLLMAGILGWGILLAVRGQLWLLIVSLVVYALAFAKLGCLPSKGHG